MKRPLLILLLLASAAPVLNAQPTPTKHWPLDALPVTEVISGTPATLMNGNPQITGGIVNNALLLEDSTLLNIGQVVSTTDSRFTLMMWYRHLNQQSGPVFSQTIPSDSIQVLGFENGYSALHAGPVVGLPLDSYGNYAFTFQNQVWKNVAYVIDTVARTGKIYVNGQVDSIFYYDASFVMTSFLNGVDALIGGDTSAYFGVLNTYYTDCMIDDIRYYNDTLTQAQVQSAMGANAPTYCQWGINFWGSFIPGFQGWSGITFYNNSNFNQSGTLWLYWPHTDYDLLNPIPAPTSTSGDTLFWDVNGLNSYWGYYWVQFATMTDSTVAVGTQFPVSYGFNSDSSCTNGLLTPNVVYDTLTTIGSYDPNDKQCSAADALPGEWLTYTIRFQNMGTAPAQRIYVRDTLSTLLDFSTITVAGTSHDMYPVYNDVDRVVTFVYNPISLPDSASNPAGSIGFVTFRVQVANSFAATDSIENRAGIFFDFNPVVLTNTVVTPYRVSTSTLADETLANSLNLWPNPTSGLLNVSLPTAATLRVLDAQGRLVLTLPTPATQTELDVRSLPTGLYTLVAETAQGTVTRRFVKQ
jgi:uncharacterized repeat protein (TIGR01451 family)